MREFEKSIERLLGVVQAFKCPKCRDVRSESLGDVYMQCLKCGNVWKFTYGEEDQKRLKKLNELINKTL